AANGLRPGVNRLRVEAVRPGASVPVDTVSQFVVAYPSARSIGLSPGSIVGRDGAVAPRLRLPTSGLSSESIALNGTNVTAALAMPDPADGSRRLELSAAQGLHWGRNTLMVRVVMFDGQAQTVRRTFNLSRRHDIAGVRSRGVAHVGRHVRL